MNDSNVLEAVEQVDASDAGEIFRDWLRDEMRSLIADVLADEVTALCGVAYRPDPDGYCRRSGGTYVGVRIDGVEQRIRKPRVRRHGANGSQEVRLRSYEAVRRADDLRDRILRATAAGVSTRDQQELYPEASPSRSAVSRAWIVEGPEGTGDSRFLARKAEGTGDSRFLARKAGSGAFCLFRIPARPGTRAPRVPAPGSPFTFS